MRTPDSWHKAQATVAIAVVTAIAYVIVSTFRADGWAADAGGFVPATVGGPIGAQLVPWFLTPLTATLLHASFAHLAFNLLIFVFCGRAVENVLGPASQVVLYLAGAYAAAAGQYAAGPHADIVMIGASGAASAVIGAYAMLFGRNRVRVANNRLAVWLNALWLLAAWVVMQVAVGIVLGEADGLMLAVGAHIGGFVAGLALARPLLLWRYRKA